jgi:hypothetical protein
MAAQFIDRWLPAIRPSIIRAMTLSLPLKKLTAMLLPATTLWLWAACAVICGQELAEHTLSAAPSAELAELRDAPPCEGCPFASFPKTTAPDSRASFDASSQMLPTPPPAPAAWSEVCHSVLVQSRRPPPAANPPLELLSTLRI